MARFCRQCGQSLNAEAKFCPFCGLSVNIEIKNDQEENRTVKVRKRKAIRISLCSVVLFILGYSIWFGYKIWLRESGSPTSVNVATEMQIEKLPSVAENVVSTSAITKSHIEEIQEILETKGYSGKVLASSYRGHQKNSLSLVSAGGLRFVIYNAVDNQVAYVDYDSKIYHFSRASGVYHSPVVFVMDIQNAVRDKDAEAGLWLKTTHKIPIYALYDVQNGQIVPGRLTTAQGVVRSSHYQAFLYDQKTVNTANILLTEMDALAESVNLHHISLP